MSIQKEFALYVPIKGETSKQVGSVVQNDIGGNKIFIHLTDITGPVDITGYTNVTFSVLKPDGTYSVDSLGDRISVINALEGQISVVLHDSAINVAGSCLATLEIFAGSIRITSARMAYVVTSDLTVGANPAVDTNYPIFLNLMVEMNALKTDLETAEGLRVIAEGTRVSNEDTRSSSEESRVLAENSRVSAEGSRNTAESGRVSAEGLRVAAEASRESEHDATLLFEAYNNAKAYVPGNKVSYNGSSYINTTASTGVLPTNTSYWLLIASKGDVGINWRGAYSSATAYAVKDAVYYNGASYYCIQAATNIVPTNTAYWDLIGSKGIVVRDLEIVTTAGQTALSTASIGSYMPGTKTMSVYKKNIAGVYERLDSGNFTETSGTVVTLSYPAMANDEYFLQWFESNPDFVSIFAPINSPTFTGTVSGITKTMVGLGNVDNTSDANKPVSTAQQTALNAKASLTGIETLTNKRITKRVYAAASVASHSFGVGSYDMSTILAQAEALTIAAPGGDTPTNGQQIMIRIKDNGTARALAWDAIFRAIGVTLPTTTIAGKTLYIGAIYNSAAVKWDVLAVGQEA